MGERREKSHHSDSATVSGPVASSNSSKKYDNELTMLTEVEHEAFPIFCF